MSGAGEAIWIFRHAESVSNAGGRTDDPRTIPLTPRGEQQAQTLAESLARAPSRVIASPFLRAGQTAAPIHTRFAAADRDVWAIEEFTYLDPAHCVGTTWQDRLPRLEAYWRRGDPRFRDGPGAETFSELVARVRAFLGRLETLETELAVFVSHGLFMQVTKLLVDEPGLDDQAAMAAFMERQLKTPFSNCERLVIGRERRSLRARRG